MENSVVAPPLRAPDHLLASLNSIQCGLRCLTCNSCSELVFRACQHVYCRSCVTIPCENCRESTGKFTKSLVLSDISIEIASLCNVWGLALSDASKSVDGLSFFGNNLDNHEPENHGTEDETNIPCEEYQSLPLHQQMDLELAPSSQTQSLQQKDRQDIFVRTQQQQREPLQQTEYIPDTYYDDSANCFEFEDDEAEEIIIAASTQLDTAASITSSAAAVAATATGDNLKPCNMRTMVSDTELQQDVNFKLMDEVDEDGDAEVRMKQGHFPLVQSQADDNDDDNDRGWMIPHTEYQSYGSDFDSQDIDDDEDDENEHEIKKAGARVKRVCRELDADMRGVDDTQMQLEREDDVDMDGVHTQLEDGGGGGDNGDAVEGRISVGSNGIGGTLAAAHVLACTQQSHHNMSSRGDSISSNWAVQGSIEDHKHNTKEVPSQEAQDIGVMDEEEQIAHTPDSIHRQMSEDEQLSPCLNEHYISPFKAKMSKRDAVADDVDVILHQMPPTAVEAQSSSCSALETEATLEDDCYNVAQQIMMKVRAIESMLHCH